MYLKFVHWYILQKYVPVSWDKTFNYSDSAAVVTALEVDPRDNVIDGTEVVKGMMNIQII